MRILKNFSGNKNATKANTQYKKLGISSLLVLCFSKKVGTHWILMHFENPTVLYSHHCATL